MDLHSFVRRIDAIFSPTAVKFLIFSQPFPPSCHCVPLGVQIAHMGTSFFIFADRLFLAGY